MIQGSDCQILSAFYTKPALCPLCKLLTSSPQTQSPFVAFSPSLIDTLTASIFTWYSYSIIASRCMVSYRAHAQLASSPGPSPREKGLVHTDCACVVLYPESGYIVYFRKILCKLIIYDYVICLFLLAYDQQTY